MKGLISLLIALGVVAVVIAFVFGVSAWTGLMVVGLIIAAPIAGGLVAIFVPGPLVVKAIAGLSVSIVALVYGLSYLKVL